MAANRHPGSRGGSDGPTDEDMAVLQRRIDNLRSLEGAAWCELTIDGRCPPGRLWHSLATIGNKESICMFGGVDARSGRMLDDTWLLELPLTPDSAARWRQLKPRGARPPPRAHHDACVVEGRWLVVHGGLLENGCRNDDTWRLDLVNDEPVWEELGSMTRTPRPRARYHHTMTTTSSGKVVLFGGHDYARMALDDAWVLDVCGNQKAAAIRWHRVAESFLRPEGRAYHAAVMVGDNLLVCGGELHDRSCSDDLWMLDVPKEMWHRVQVFDTGGKDVANILGAGGRMRHMACCLDKDRGIVAVCGGQGRSMRNARPVDCLLLQLTQDGSHGFRCDLMNQPYMPSLAQQRSPYRARRDAAMYKLPSGHLVLFGGNDGSFVDEFGDGYHQHGCDEVLVAETAGVAVGNVGGWHCVSRSAPKATAFGRAVAMVERRNQVVVVDHVEQDTLVARACVLSLG